MAVFTFGNEPTPTPGATSLPDYHTKGAINLFRTYLNRTSSWIEYQESTVALMMHIVYQKKSLAQKPLVVAMTESIRDITDYVEASFLSQDHGPGALKVGTMEVQWEVGGLGAVAGIKSEGVRITLDEYNLSAVLRLIKQRPGSDTVLVTIDNVSGNGASAHVSGRLQTMEETGFGEQPSHLGDSAQSQNASQIGPPTSQSKEIAINYKQLKSKKSSRSGRDKSSTTPSAERLEEGEVLENRAVKSDPRVKNTNHSAPNKSIKAAVRSSGRLPDSFFAVLGENAKKGQDAKRKHRNSSGSDGETSRRTKDDVPSEERRDRRRDGNPFGGPCVGN